MSKNAFFSLQLCLFLMACTAVPTYEEVTGKGPEESQVLVRDIVGRVKCELANAFNDKLHDREFLWLQDWTVKSELTLSVSTQAGLLPSGGYTSYQRSAVNRAAGPSNYPGTTLPTVPQFFNFGASAEFNEQALLTEVVDFTVSLKELQALNPDSPSCNPGRQTELLGNLGLRDWVNSVLVPVKEGYLTAGVHPAPGAGKPSTVSVAKLAFGPGGAGPTAEIGLCEKLKQDKENWLQKAVDEISSIKTQIGSAYMDLSTIDDAVNTAVSNYPNVLNEQLKRKYLKFKSAKGDADRVKNSI